jgi:hypothetical protein
MIKKPTVEMTMAEAKGVIKEHADQLTAIMRYLSIGILEVKVGGRLVLTISLDKEEAINIE